MIQSRLKSPNKIKKRMDKLWFEMVMDLLVPLFFKFSWPFFKSLYIPIFYDFWN